MDVRQPIDESDDLRNRSASNPGSDEIAMFLARDPYLVSGSRVFHCRRRCQYFGVSDRFNTFPVTYENPLTTDLEAEASSGASPVTRR